MTICGMKPMTAPTPATMPSMHEGLQPRRDVCRFHGIGDDGAKTRVHPQAPRAVGRIGLFDLKRLLVIGERDGLLLHVAVLVLYLHRGHGMGCLRLLVEVGDDGLRLLIFSHGHPHIRPRRPQSASSSGASGSSAAKASNTSCDSSARQLGLFILAQNVLDISHNLGMRVLVFLGGLVERGVAGVEPAVAGDAVVGPVGHHAAPTETRQASTQRT